MLFERTQYEITNFRLQWNIKDKKAHRRELSFNTSTSTGQPGSQIDFVFLDETNVPSFDSGKDYYAVFFHGVRNITAPLDTKANSSVIPREFDAGRGIIMAVLADEEEAPTLESVVAGPVFLLEQPQELTRQI